MALEFDISVLSTLVDHTNVILQNGGDDRDHISFHYSGSYDFRATDSNIDDTLESEVPLPALQKICCIPAFFEDADQPLNTAIDG
jgi:hypothetical protein